MLLTEKDARTTQCCGPEGCGFRDGTSRTCVGSQCMGWRWGSPHIQTVETRDAMPGERRPDGFHGYQANDPDRAGAGGKWTKQVRTPQGYCGLAGNPEAQS